MHCAIWGIPTPPLGCASVIGNSTIIMAKAQKSYRKKILQRMAKAQPSFAFLSIIQNFSLGFLWKAFHKRPDEKF